MAEATTSKWDSHLRMMLRGAVGGLFAGVIFGMFQMWYLADAGMPANTIIRMIATIVQPDEYFAAGTTLVPIGWAVHRRSPGCPVLQGGEEWRFVSPAR